MASAVIHLAVAKVLEKDYKIKYKKDYYLGSIAPDLAKQIGQTKNKSHFIINEKESIPNIDIFTNKYKKFKKNSFELGYFIHLYTDKLWYQYFTPNFQCNNSLKLLDGTIIQVTPEEATDLIYTDYTNLNIKLIEDYNLDLSLFYEKFKKPDTIITEIPINKLNILIDKMGIIIENSKQEKTYTFDAYQVEEFINKASSTIKEELKKY